MHKGKLLNKDVFPQGRNSFSLVNSIFIFVLFYFSIITVYLILTLNEHVNLLSICLFIFFKLLFHFT